MVEAYESSENGEFCISPVSLSIYMSMLANASAGDCHDQILQALGSENIDKLNSLCRKLMQYLPNDENRSSLSINNHFWVAKHNNVPNDFISIMNHYFNCGVDYVDFNKKSTFQNINRWVSDCTRGNITEVINEDIWEAYRDREMISANTVYFKGDWVEQFSEEKTKPGIFHTPQGDVKVDMMNERLNLIYSENDFVKFTNLGFVGNNIMELYLPAEGTTLQQLIEKLSPSEISQIYSSANYYSVKLSIPKFRKKYEAVMTDIIEKIGITSIKNVDLSPMGLKTLPEHLIHNTSIKIDEEGAEIAAFTADILYGANLVPDKKNVVLDFNRPFLYIIRNTKTGAILMAGTMTDPR